MIFLVSYCIRCCGDTDPRDSTQKRGPRVKLRKFRHLAELAGLGGSLLLAGCTNAALLDPAGRVGVQERSLIVTATLLMLLVVVPTIVLTLFFARRYRASNARARYDPEWSHSRGIEVVVWALPLVIVAVLGVIAWVSTHELDPFKPLASKARPLTIEVVSLDWKWLFIYPDQGIASVNETAFPSNVPVRFVITSASVMSSFFIPRLGSQIYAMAGMQTEVNLIADRPGSYDGISAQFDGPGFSGMNFKALALPSEEQFEDWVAAARRSPHSLDRRSYDELAEPSANSPVEYFSTVTPSLFQNIIAAYMGGSMNMPQGGEPMPMQGAANVR